MCLEFEMLRSFNSDYELLRYITNTIENWKTEIKSIFNTVCLLFNAYSYFVEGGRGEGGGVLELLWELLSSRSSTGFQS